MTKITLAVFMLLMSGCSSSAVESEHTVARDLSQMELIPKWDADFNLVGFHYPFRVCVKKFLWTCTEWKLVSQEFPESNKELMRIIKAKDFTCQVRKEL